MPAAKAMSPTRSLVVPWASRAWSLLGVVSICPRAAARRRARAAAGCARGPTPPTRAVSCSSEDSIDEPAAVDDQHLVDGLGDLGEDVARDQHGAALGGERAQEVAQPAHPLRVEAVGGLVEDEQLGVAEQRRREPEPLAHPERVALDAAAGGAVELDQPQHLVDPRVGELGGAAERPQMVASGAAGMEVGRLEHRADPQRGLLELRVGLAEDERAPARRAPPARAASAASSSCPAPFGPRKPVIVPGSSANDRSSTAVSLPNRFVRSSLTTTGAAGSGAP